jgi:hypothetical protein
MKPPSGGFFLEFFVSQYIIPVILVIVGVVAVVLGSTNLDEALKGRSTWLKLIIILPCIGTFIYLIQSEPTNFFGNALFIFSCLIWGLKFIQPKLSAESRARILMDGFLNVLVFKLFYWSVAILNFYYAYKWFAK